MRCLVTGASGFLGSHLVRRLLSEGHEVLAVVRATSNLWRLEDVCERLQFIYSSLDEIDAISSRMREFSADVIFHLAWTGGNSRKFINEVSQVFENVPGSLELIRLAHETGCKQVIFLGSCVEYGKYRVPVKETDSAEPTNLYALAKLTTLQLSQALCAQLGIRFCGVRLFWAYGPMDDGNRMIPSVINHLLDGKRPSLTPGEQIWDFLYVEDAVRALIMLADVKSASGIFNLGSGAPLPIRDIVTLIRDAICPTLELGFGDIPYSPGQTMHLEADISRLHAATGWSPKVSIRDGIAWTIKWHAAERAKNAN